MIFQCDGEPVLSHRILIVFEAILERILSSISLTLNIEILIRQTERQVQQKIGQKDKVIKYTTFTFDKKKIYLFF